MSKSPPPSEVGLPCDRQTYRRVHKSIQKKYLVKNTNRHKGQRVCSPPDMKYPKSWHWFTTSFPSQGTGKRDLEWKTQTDINNGKQLSLSLRPSQTQRPMKWSTHEHKEQQANPRPIQRYLNCEQQRQTDRETGEQVPHPPEIPVCVERAASSTALGPAACLGGAASARTTDVAHNQIKANKCHACCPIKASRFYTWSDQDCRVSHIIPSQTAGFTPDQIKTIKFHTRPDQHDKVSCATSSQPTGFTHD